MNYIINKRRVAVIAHFDANGECEPYFSYFVKKISSLCERVIVVSTSGIKDHDFNTNVEVINRGNYGYDFASYKIGIENIKDISLYDQLIICNDSFYINDDFCIQKLLSFSDDDALSISDNHQFSHHLQSYFIVFNKKVLMSDFFFKFWHKVLFYKNKMKIVFDYEIALTNLLKVNGFTVNSFYKSQCVNFNPCHNESLQLLESSGVLKIDSIRNEIIKFDYSRYFSLEYNKLIEENIRRTKGFYKDRKLSLSNHVVVSESLFEYQTCNQKSEYAVILHLYYDDLALEILSHLKNIPFDFDIYISVKDESVILNIIDIFNKVAKNVFIYVSENKGRDVRPFFELLQKKRLEILFSSVKNTF
ncbi:rhamnan synthesis F family protein [Photobacterium damselae]|uniref:rhamnan synthesis F family protein n=1 Tax=Photobacterium damselae TaxID=38293 RepID=UPI0009C057C6|nr:rhamnan synthesis F family protein [Photobacterium damselae]